MLNPKILKALKRWAAPTVERYREHVAICERDGIEPSLFEAFASDVLTTPEDKRDWLLTFEPLPEFIPFVRLRQYESPRMEEQKLGIWGGKK